MLTHYRWWKFIQFGCTLILILSALVACAGNTPATATIATPVSPSTVASKPTDSATTPTVATPTQPIATPTVVMPSPTQPVATPTVVIPSPTQPMPTQIVTPTTQADLNKTIVIGIAHPNSMDRKLMKRSDPDKQIFAAVQPDCIAQQNYTYQPVCFTRIPSLEQNDITSKNLDINALYRQPFVFNDTLYENGNALTEVVTLPQISVTFHIIKGMTWEDGIPVTAHDFVRAYGLDKGNTNQMGIYVYTAEVKAIDDYTFVWTGLPGFVTPTPFLNYFDPEPTHEQVVNKINSNPLLKGYYKTYPLSYGPYKIVSAENYDLTLTANPFYWRANEGLPRVGNLVFKAYNYDDDFIGEVKKGNIDIHQALPLDFQYLYPVENGVSNGTFKAQFVKSSDWLHLDFTLDHLERDYDKDVDVPTTTILQDLRLRQAIAYGLDRQKLMDIGVNGRSQIVNSLVPDEHPIYPANGAGLTLYPYDVERAKQLLDEAGWTMQADGIRQKDGKQLSLEFTIEYYSSTDETLSTEIKNQLAPLGIAVEISKPHPGMANMVSHDLVINTANREVEPQIDRFACAQSAYQNYMDNIAFWCDPTFNDLVKQVSMTYDPTQLNQLYYEAQARFTADLPALPLYQSVAFTTYKPNLTGIQIDPSNDLITWNVEQWDIQ